MIRVAKKIEKIIYCDGSCLGNPGIGAFAVVAIDTKKEKVWEYGEVKKHTTNNEMELSACLFALKLILKSLENSKLKNQNIAGDNLYELRLDSKYVLQGINEWSKNWIKNGWKNAQKKDVANKELWIQILKMKNEIESKETKIIWTHVYGHSGEIWNERVDEIARCLAEGKEIHKRLREKYN